MNSGSRPLRGAVLLGHGSREPRTETEMRALREALEKEHPDWGFAHAFLNGDPGLAAAAASLVAADCREIRVIPLLVFTGKHLLADVPEMIASLRGSHPEVAFALEPHLAELPGFRDLIGNLLSSPPKI